MKVKGRFRDPERMSLFPELRRGNRYRDYVNVFPGPNLCPLNRGVLKERFHCKYLHQ